ncbi:MAG: adenosylcobinamide-GDP ribazoletransferase [Candidatus Anammoxibacter sp.]
MKDFLWVFSFLTIIPFNRKWFTDTPNIRNVIFWFPIVGLLIGLSLAIVYFLLTNVIPFAVADAVILMFYFLLTGGLHLDGLADTCDGIFGGKDRESRLKIMRDSSIGSFGVIGLICLIGIKYLCFYSICKDGLISIDFLTIFPDSLIDPNSDLYCRLEKCIILFLMPSIGRLAQILGASISGYARNDESGTGIFIIKNSRLNHVYCSAGVPFLLMFFFCGGKGLGLLLVICVLSLMFVKFIKKRIDGMTGDTLGALNEISELIFLCAFIL